LQILGQASKPAVIQTHMKKLFAGIYNVNFDEENKHIVSMNSIEGESVPLKNKVRISNEVEHWLNELAKEMKGMYVIFFFQIISIPLKYPDSI
jgi:dynein heavy chain 2